MSYVFAGVSFSYPRTWYFSENDILTAWAVPYHVDHFYEESVRNALNRFDKSESLLDWLGWRKAYSSQRINVTWHASMKSSQHSNSQQVPKQLSNQLNNLAFVEHLPCITGESENHVYYLYRVWMGGHILGFFLDETDSRHPRGIFHKHECSHWRIPRFSGLHFSVLEAPKKWETVSVNSSENIYHCKIHFGKLAY